LDHLPSSLFVALCIIGFDLQLKDHQPATQLSSQPVNMAETTDNRDGETTDVGSDHSPTVAPEKKNDAEKAAPSDDEEEYKHVYPQGMSLYGILTAVVLAYFLVYLDLAIMSTATPSITSAFDSIVDIGWYGGAYQLASAAFQPLSGKIYTYFSIKAGSPRHPHPYQI
jgi:hypothetical protein